MLKEQTVLCYLKKNDSFLFLHRNKREKDINKDKWIGVGGHIEEGETKEQALIREVKEETGLTIRSFVHRGNIVFVNNDYEEIMFLYISDDFSGTMVECDEGELSWVNKSEIMKLNLWEGDRYFLPILIDSDEFINIKLIYRDDHLVEIVKD